jgi:F-type H+-transporting ATPase subunit b
MLIDWFTVGAQALNFLILVWLMRHFLYQPILHAIDTREKKIAAELADADAKRAEAKKDRDEFQHKNEVFEQQRAALLTKATDEAKAEGQRLLGEARTAADALSAKRSEALKNDARNLNQAVARRTQEEVFSIARKALTDLATTSLEERLGDVFTRRLREMDGKAKEVLGPALKTGPEPAVVRSAFALPAEERAKIQNAINETFSADVHLRFETAPDRISGIELTANGQKVAWSIADYLTSLEKGVSELLKQQDKPEPKPAAKPDAKPGSNSEPAPKAESEERAKPKAETDSQAAPKPAAPAPPEPKATADPAPKPNSGAQAKSKTEAEPTAAPKSDATPEPKPAAAAKEKPATEAEPQAAAKPGAKPELPSKPRAKVEPAAEPSAPDKAVPEAKTESTPPKTAAAPKPEAKAEPAAAAPASAAKPEANATSKPDTDPEAKSEAKAEAAPVGS